MGWAPNRLRNSATSSFLVLVYGILALLVWGRVLAAFQLHYNPELSLSREGDMLSVRASHM
jgi:hypothetical protein